MERTLVVNIIGDSASAERAFGKTGAAAGAAAAEVGRAGSSVESTGAKIESAGRKLSGVGTSLSKYVSLPLVGVGAAAVHMSLDFDKSMLLIETHTESTRKEVALYKREILEMAASGKYTQGPKELAEALYHIASDGYRGREAIRVLKQSADLAMLGQSELAETTYAVVSAMKTGIKGTEDFHEAIGTLNGTMGAGDTKMQELVAGLSTGVVPSARAAGLELTDVGAAMAFLTARGIPAQKAAYGLSMNFQQLVPYTKKAKEEFEALGIPLEELGEKAESGPMGWLKALEDLKRHMKEVGLDVHQETQAIEEIFGGGRSSRGVLAQMQNLKDLGATYERVGVIGARTDHNLAIARESEANQWKEEWAQAQAVLVELGNDLTPVLLPVLKEVAHDVEDVVELFDQLPHGTQGWIVSLGIAAAALGPVVKGVGLITTGVGKATKAYEAMTAAEGAANLTMGAGAMPAMPIVPTGAGAAARTAGADAAVAAGEGVAVSRWLGTESTHPIFGSFLWAGPEGGRALQAAGRATVPIASPQSLSEDEAVRDALGIGAGGTVSGALKGAASKAFMVLGGLVGGYFAAEFGAHAVEGLTGADLLENQDLKTSLTHGFNTSNVAETEALGLASVGHKARGINVNFAQGTHAELVEVEHSYHDALTRIAGDTAAGLKYINTDLHTGLDIANQVWIEGTKPWRLHTAQAMEATVASIRTGMHDGTINAEEGQKEINHLLARIHLVKGDDPFGLAQATAKSFKEAGAITETGVRNWASELTQMPAAARKSSIESTNQMLQAWAQGHPKLERQIESLTRFEITHFGATNKQLREGVKKGATGPIAEAFAEAAAGVGGALENIGTNTSDLLKALGLHDIVQFQALVLGPSHLSRLTGPEAAERHHHEAPGSYSGKGVQGHAAGGSITRVAGTGLHDTVPLFTNGAMSAWVAPGEDLVAFNRHQRPLADFAFANTFGVNGLPGFFEEFDRPHYLAGGGEVKVKGPGAIAQIGHQALKLAVDGANRYIDQHRPKAPAGIPGAGGHAFHHGKYTFPLPAGTWGPPMSIDQGVDIAAPGHTPLLAIAPGTILGHGISGFGPSAPILGIGNGTRVYYGHAGPGHELPVGTHVRAGQVIGEVGEGIVGISSGPHLEIGYYPPGAMGAGAQMAADLGLHLARGGPIGRFAGGGLIKGKVSWFNGGATAGGSDTSHPGIAVNLSPGSESGWNNPTTQKWMEDSRAGHPVYANVSIDGHSANLPIIDLGPAGFTDRAIDVTEGGVRKLGFSTSDFPTDAVGTATLLTSGGGSAGHGAKGAKTTPKHPAGYTDPKTGGTYGSPASPAPASKTTAPTLPPLGPSTVGLAGIDLPASVQKQLRQPGLTAADKMAIAEQALEHAEHTRSTQDNEAAIHYEQSLLHKQEKKIREGIAQIDRELKQNLTKKQRQKLISKRSELLSELGGVEGSLAGAKEKLTELHNPEKPEGEEENPAVKAAEEAKEAAEEQKRAAEELKASIDELKKTIAQQVRNEQVGEGITAQEALRALADATVGQLGPMMRPATLRVGNGTVGSS